MNKLNSEILFNEEKISYLKIIENQTLKLTKSLLNGEKYESFYLNW